jgi:hypothetical protein
MLAGNYTAKKRVREKSVIIREIKDEIRGLRLAKTLELRPILWDQLRLHPRPTHPKE